MTDGLWEIPAIWPDATAFIIGGGPSLIGVDLTPLHDKRVIGVNQAYELGSWIDVCYFGDRRWFDWNKEALKEFPGLVITSLGKLKFPGWVLKVTRDHKPGIEHKNKKKVMWNYNSGASAINLAVHFGVKRIVLLGFDMKTNKTTGKNGGHNWHDKHKNKSPDDIYDNRFMKAFAFIKKDLDKLGIECLNASPDSAIKEFPLVNLEDML